MQIVIKIPDSKIPKQQAIVEIPLHFVDGTVCEVGGYGFNVLPKGHGKLIDVGQCDRKLFYQQCGGADSLITVKSAFDMLMSLPTIIEAERSEDKKMTREEFAKRLDGSAYPFHLTPSDSIIAKQEGFVVVYGASDDLVEFDGCYEEEAGCFDGDIVSFDRNGTSDDREDHANLLEVYWCGKCNNKTITTDAAWEYRAGFPASTFKIYDDGELYCRGLVVDVKDLQNIEKI